MRIEGVKGQEMTGPSTHSATRDATRPAEPELARLSLERTGPLGDTLAQFEGESISVFGGIPGEEVVAEIVRFRRRRTRHVHAIVTDVIQSSPHRVNPPCPYFGPCSGCQWQHVSYSHQLKLKRQAVEAELVRYPELEHLDVSPTLPSKAELGYRNHARFTVKRDGSLGFVNRITRRFVRVDRCMLMSPWINETLASLQGRCGETTQLSMRYGVNTGDWLVQPSLAADRVGLTTGQTHYREKLHDRPFRVSSPSFFQVNTGQAELLGSLVLGRLGLTGRETVIDAYAGVGAFAVLMAAHAARVIAIEEADSAIKDAAINTLGLQNLDFRRGRTEDVLASLRERPDAVILDPPRVGCHEAVLRWLVERAPGRVAYVSCDPESLARDLSILVRGGFRVEAVEPVDMFPQTHHVECLVTLEPGAELVRSAA